MERITGSSFSDYDAKHLYYDKRCYIGTDMGKTISKKKCQDSFAVGIERNCDLLFSPSHMPEYLVDACIGVFERNFFHRKYSSSDFDFIDSVVFKETWFCNECGCNWE